MGMTIRIKTTIGLRRTCAVLAVLLIMWCCYFDQTIFAMSGMGSMLFTCAALALALGCISLNLRRMAVTDVMLLATLAFIALHNDEVLRGNFYYLLTYILLVILALSRRRMCQHWARTFSRFVLVFGLAALAFTYVCAVFPQFYEGLLQGYLRTAIYYDSLVYTHRNGYIAGLAMHYSSNGGFLAMLCGL